MIYKPKRDILFIDGSKKWDLNLAGNRVPQAETSQTPSTLIINPGGGRYGSKDPTFSEYEQETWHGGALGEYYHDDQTNYADASGVNTRFAKKLFLNSIWKLAKGIRTRSQYMPGSVTWQGLYGTYRAIAVQVADNGTYDFGNLLIRRRGNPGTLTFELRADSSSMPTGAVAKTVTKTTSDITDELSLFETFDWTSTQAVASHWVVIYGASTDDARNHWELGVDAATSGGKYISDPSQTAWLTGTFKPYHFLSDADSDVKWWPIKIGTNLYIINQPGSGNSVIKLWNETTKTFDAVSPTGDAISGQCQSACVAGGLGWLAFGNGGTYIMQFDHNSGSPRLNLDVAVKADIIIQGTHPTAGTQVFWADNSTKQAKRATPTAYNTDLTVGDTWQMGTSFNIIGLAAHGSDVVVRQANSLQKITYDVTRNDELVVDLNTALRAVEETATYQPMLSVGDLFFYPLQHTLMKTSLNSSVSQDVGLWRGVGLPDGRQGVISSMCIGDGHGAYFGIDAGSSGISSVWYYDFVAWHEVWRAWKAGIRVRNIFWQAQNGTTNPSRLWINCGNDLIYIDQPNNSMLPLNDPNTDYMWEGYVTSTIHDFDTFQLKKLFEYIDIISQNLGRNVWIELDVRTDKDVGTTSWKRVNVAKVVTSPRYRAKLGMDNAYLLQYRLRLNTSDNSTSPLQRAAVLAGVARTPLKRIWSLRVPLGTGQPDYKYDELYDWFLDAARNTSVVKMYAGAKNMDNISVLIQPPRLIPTGYNKSSRKFDALLDVQVLEVETRDDIKY